MKTHRNYISNVIYEESNEDSNSISKLNLKKNKIPNKHLSNEGDLQNIFSREETYFLKKESSNNSSFENSEMNLSEIDEINIIVNYNQVIEYFSNLKYSNKKKFLSYDNLEKENCCSSFFICGKEKLKLNPNLKKEKENIICFSKILYNENNNIHYNILTTIYNFLTESNFCPKKGNHWLKIGLNLNYDLKMFCLIQILFLKDYYSNFLKNLFSYLLKYNCEWLFISSLLNLTKITLDCLRNGTLIPICNRRENVINVVNDFFCGLVYQFYLFLEIPEEQKLTAEFISIQIDNLKKLGNKTPNLILSKKNDLDNYNYL